MGETREVGESPEKQITKSPEKKIETFDDLRSYDEPERINTFSDIKEQGSDRPLRTFDDIAKSGKASIHYEGGKSIEKNLLNKDIRDEGEKKSEIVEEIVTNKFSANVEKQSDNTKDLHYLDNERFTEELKERDSLATPKDIDHTAGFFDRRDNQAFVKGNGDTLLTSIHEKLHQKSKSELSTRLDEGITEYFAQKGAGALGDLKQIDVRGREIPRPRSDYDKEVEIVGKLEATIGAEPMNRAYFDGKTDVLKNHIDSVLGEGAFQTFSDALERKDYENASKIISKLNKKTI